MSRVNIIVAGAAGRMGQEIIKIIENDENLDIAATVDRAGKGHTKNIADLSLAAANVMIDFSLPEAFQDLVSWCRTQKVPFVSGTTGLSKKNFSFLEEASGDIPVLWSPNMSLGVAVLSSLISKLEAVKEEFDFQIEEFHHIHKKDKPSGTAVKLQRDLEKAVGTTVSDPISIRGGGIFGIHKVWAMSGEETICLEHTALNRTVFARGAVKAAQWLVNQSPGQYTIKDVLSLD